jgi:hypothetical protein
MFHAHLAHTLPEPRAEDTPYHTRQAHPLLLDQSASSDGQRLSHFAVSEERLTLSPPAPASGPFARSAWGARGAGDCNSSRTCRLISVLYSYESTSHVLCPTVPTAADAPCSPPCTALNMKTQTDWCQKAQQSRCMCKYIQTSRITKRPLPPGHEALPACDTGSILLSRPGLKSIHCSGK